MAPQQGEIFGIRRNELPFALSMLMYFFLVTTTFWILKPIKKALFIEFYERRGFDLLSWHLAAAEAELLAKVLNMAVALVAATVFARLSLSLRREQLTYAFSFFFIPAFVVYAFALAHPQAATVWSFYLFGDLFSTLMVATFFTYLNDSVTPERAKRIYGLVGMGGVLGGVFGSSTVRAMIASVSRSEWLWICVGLGIAVVGIAYVAARSARSWTGELSRSAAQSAQAESGHSALEGARLIRRSPYLLAVVAIVGLYEIVSTIMDFQFTSTVAHYLEGPAIAQQFATAFAITNIASMVVQLGLTSLVMRRFGVGVALLFLPFAALAGSTAFLLAPTLLMGTLLNTADNAFSYSINQSAKESLYVPTSTAEKYQAKAFIDMFVQRFAKALAVGVSLTLSAMFGEFESVRWLSLITGVIIAAWIVAAVYAGRRFRELTATPLGVGPQL